MTSPRALQPLIWLRMIIFSSGRDPLPRSSAALEARYVPRARPRSPTLAPARRPFWQLIKRNQSLAVLFCLGLAGCDETPREIAQTLPRLEPKRDIKAPEGYTGPIDPAWPPSNPLPLETRLRAGRMVRARLARGEAPFPAPINAQEGPLHVEAGKLGEFAYLEAIVGRPKHPDDPMPLVVILHGRGGKAQVPEGAMSTDIPVRFFMPQSPDKLGQGFTWLAARTKDPDEQLFARSLSARADQLQLTIEAFREMRPTLGKPVVAGFSQGGILTYALATRYPSRYAAAFPMAGWLPAALYPDQRGDRRFPYVYAQHGALDSVVPPSRGRATVAALRARGLTVDYREEAGAGHVVSPKMNSEVRRAMARFFEVFRDSVAIQSAKRG